jgi:FKBP-type peptidyl-prolyl cis-trans isomerase SlyD
MRPQIISFKCILKNQAGQLISTTFNRDVLTSLGTEQPTGPLSGLSKNLQNLKKGEKRLIQLKADEAYGLYYPQKVILYPRKNLPKDIRVGDPITILSKTGEKHFYTVLQLLPHFASLDGNHPLAGQDLTFEIEALDVRDATQEEVASANNVVEQQLLH